MHTTQAFGIALILFCALATVGGFPMALLFHDDVNVSNAAQAAYAVDIAGTTPESLSTSTSATSTSIFRSIAANEIIELDIYSDLFYFIMGGDNFNGVAATQTACGAAAAVVTSPTTTSATTVESLRGKRANGDVVFHNLLDEMPLEMVELLTGGGNRSTLIGILSHLFPRVGDDLAYTCTINSFSSFVLFREEPKSVVECQEIEHLIESFEAACAPHDDRAIFQGVRNSLHFFDDLLCSNSSERFLALSLDLSECKHFLRGFDSEMEKKVKEKCAADLNSEEAVCKALFFCTVDEVAATLDKECQSRSPQSYADRHRLFRVIEFLFTMLASHGSIGETCGSMIIP